MCLQPEKSNGPRSRWLVFPLVRQLALASFILVVSACDPLGPESDDLASARSRWTAAGVQSYAFEYWADCMVCGEASGVVEVANGSVSLVSAAGSGDLLAWPVTEPPTVEDLFDRIEILIGDGPDSFHAEYDRVLGYPVSVSIDYDERSIDDEGSFGVTSLQALAPALR